LIDRNPEIRRSDLRRANQRDYEWLRHNDQEWFEASLPKKQDLKINWKKRDEEWLEIITKTYERLVEYPIELKRISIYSLFIEAGLNKDQIYLHKEKLPKIMDFLNENIESKDDWRKRKIDVTIKNLYAEGKTLSFTRIHAEVGISYKEYKKHITYVEKLLKEYSL